MKITITKEQIAEMPVVVFDGQIITIDSPIDAEKAIAYLSRQKVVGIDTETRPSFKKGQVHKVSLMQLSTPKECFLFRLNRIGFTDGLVDLLTSDKVTKIGLSLRDDFNGLRKLTPFEPQNVVELQTLVPRYGIGEASLQKIFAILFNQKISKSQRLTNWEADLLTEPQKRYAATDAWACIEIYNKLTQQSVSLEETLQQTP